MTIINKPEFFKLFKSKKLTKKQFGIDVKASISVAIISLPLALALGIASGLTPKAGLITAIVAGVITSILSGSPIQIGGPTSAFVVACYNIIHTYGISGLIISTILAGILLIFLGFLKFGSLVKYISNPIIIGFTSGIALILFTSEVTSFLGLTVKTSDNFIARWSAYITHINKLDLTTTLLGILTIVIIIIWPKINKSLPSSLVALLLTTIIAQLFNLHVQTIESSFGHMTASLPSFNIPIIHIAMIPKLLIPAITIAFLSLITSLLAATSGDEFIDKKHDSNTELIAQGIANIFSVLFGGLPTAGVVARTTANGKHGAKTSIAGISHAVILFIVMVLLMPLTNYIPLTTLAGILIMVAYRMVKWKAIKTFFIEEKFDFTLFLVTLILTAAVNIVIAVIVGVALSFIFKLVPIKKVAVSS
ncbi:MAG: SulP family inorganic anion transporter [Sarcina sp.]